ncbi:unnamed protein product [Paramecium sonneborni]|uniref:Protein kinase domain-containing protein n=1 Tax=Paramecium sonneborni TaxID=65129 RepID=A0A8S1PDL1_9CILI|nr:unnamed protein product [Paramecium sonneborni]
MIVQSKWDKQQKMELSRSREREKNKKQREKEETKKEKHYKLQKDEIFNQRYLFVQAISDGTFGRVVRVFDGGENDFKAIKIIKSVKRHIQSAKIEYGILRTIHQQNQYHPGNEKIVRAYEAFSHKDNYCIVFEDLGLSLYDFMRGKYFGGFELKAVQEILYDCLQGLDFMHTSGYTHTDLKPENILLIDKQQKGKKEGHYHVKIIDLGGAVFQTDCHSQLINTRQYRAPEVILRNRWTHLSDMWCMGCIAVELFTGQQLFKPKGNDFYHLAMIEKHCGPIPIEMIQQCRNEAREYFNEYQLNDSFLKWPDDQFMVQELNLIKVFQALIPQNQQELLNLIQNLIVIEPFKRLTPKQALEHDFFKLTFN